MSKQKEAAASGESNQKRQQQIAKRLADIPKIYRRIYEQAVKGKSRKAAIHAFCLECVCWQKEEVRRCSDFGCALYALRPYQEGANHSDNRPGSAPESQDSAGGRLR
jgi:hypothetical protein